MGTVPGYRTFLILATLLNAYVSKQFEESLFDADPQHWVQK
jgi:hypothetical protein